MLFLNKKITITLLVLIAILLAFIMGVAFSAKYLLIREMQQREEILIRNLTALADCKINRCSKTRQQLLIVENDAAFKEFALLEIDSENVWYLNFSRAATLFVLSLYSDPKNVTPSGQLREYYQKIGCGLNGTMC